MRQLIRVFLVLVLVSVFTEVYACQPCYYHRDFKSQPSIRFNNADTVFIGTVIDGESVLEAIVKERADVLSRPKAIEIAKRIIPEPKDSNALVAGAVLFAVEEVFKGEPINQEIVHVGNPIIYSSCSGTTAKLNERYIVYAKHFEKDSNLYNHLYSDKCLGILPVEDSQSDLDFLWNLPPVGTGGNIQGEIKAYKHPLAGVKVNITRNNLQITSVKTDRNGLFEVQKLEAGMYRVKPELSKKYRLTQNDPKGEDLTVNDRGTARVLFQVYQEGTITGQVNHISPRVIASNTLFISLKGNGVKHQRHLLEEDGGFEFTGLPPGEYLLLLEKHEKGQEKNRYYYLDSLAPEKVKVGPDAISDNLMYTSPVKFQH